MLIRSFCKMIVLLCISLPGLSQFVNPDDESTATMLARKYKDDDVACLTSYHYFTFDKGKNSLNEKVVTVQEEAEVEFISLKKFGAITYPEFYNQFISLKAFKKSVKNGTKYVTSAKSGIDRAVTGDGIFFDDSRVQYYPIRFFQKGAVAKVSVKKEYSDGKYLTRVFFREPYPVKEQTFEFRVPEWLTVDFKTMNFENAKIERQQTSKGGYTNYVFTMRDIPGFADEYKSVGKAYTEPHIIIQIRSFESKGEVLKGFDKVDDVYGWNNKLYRMAGNDAEKLKTTYNKIIQGKTTDIDKVKAIYYWVQDNIRYLAYEDGYSGYVPAPAQDVLSKKYGDCKGMANLLVELLKLGGYDARFTWIGTRSIPYSQTLPALCVNNHAICTLYFGGKEYFLDATEKYAPLGENAFRIQGKEAMISNADKFEIKMVPPAVASDDKIITKAELTLVSNVLSGKVKVSYTGNERTGFHQSYQDLPVTSQKDFLKDLLEFGNDNMEVTNIKTSDMNNREVPVNIEGDVDLSNNVSTISGDKYISIDFFPRSLERYMPDAKRTSGYDFDYVLTYEDEISLTIPADKKFSDIPEKIDLGNDKYSFKGEYVVAGNKITLKKSLSIKNNIIKTTDFDNWKAFLESIKNFNRYFITVTNK